jgi:hypothetical protein
MAIFYCAMWHDLAPSKINDENALCILKTLYIYYVVMWHFVMGYNIFTNNGDYLQSLYRWSTDDGVYVDHIYHSCGM